MGLGGEVEDYLLQASREGEKEMEGRDREGGRERGRIWEHQWLGGKPEDITGRTVHQVQSP